MADAVGSRAREQLVENRSDLRVGRALSPVSTFFYYVFQSSVGQLTIITRGVIPKADRLEGENVTSLRRRVVRGAGRRGGAGRREKG